MSSSNSITPAGLTQFPGYFSTQIHPEHEAKVIQISMEALNGLSEVLAAHKLEDTIDTIPYIDPREKPKAGADPLYQTISLGMHRKLQFGAAPILPPETTGYYEALHYIEANLLGKKLEAMRPKEILNHLMQINQRVSESGSDKIPYRHRDSIVFNPEYIPAERTKETFRNLDAAVQRLASPTEWEIWKTSTRAKMWNNEFKKKKIAFQALDDRDVEVLKHIAFFPVDSNQIPNRMNQLAEELVLKLSSKEEIESIMAWFHDEYTAIHPYDDGNGRTARLMMNVLYMSRGKTPLLMDNDENYTRAARGGKETFEAYLRELADKQPTVHPFVERCMRTMFEASLDEKPVTLNRV